MKRCKYTIARQHFRTTMTNGCRWHIRTDLSPPSFWSDRTPSVSVLKASKPGSGEWGGWRWWLWGWWWWGGIGWHVDACDHDSPRVLLDRRLRWLVEVLWGRRVFCWWWLLSTGLVAMMLSLYLLIKDSLVLSHPDGKKVTVRGRGDRQMGGVHTHSHIQYTNTFTF